MDKKIIVGDYFYWALMIMFVFAIYQWIYPAYRRYGSYSGQRRDLEKKYNRLLRARKDLLMHFDWANARGSGESLERMESMGREIERIDQEMR